MNENTIGELQEDNVENIKRTSDDVYAELENSINQINKFVELMDTKNQDEIKRTFNFLNWMTMKINMIIEEKKFNMPKEVIPNTINSYLYGKFQEQQKELINKYYIESKSEFVLDKNKQIVTEDIKKLIDLLIIKRGTVVWIEFGFNIGKEFGGKHPALILKSIGESIIVAPLSSKTPKEVKGYHVRVNNVMKFNKKKTRWINIYRIIPVSINRIDFSSAIGNVRGEVLDDISTSIRDYGIR